MEKANKSADAKPLYFGHRKRLRERILADGGLSMPDYELLETLLTAAIPRKDVKPLAKNLIAHFGSFAKVISAEPCDLLAAKTPKGAMIYLKTIHNISKRISSQFLREKNEIVLSNMDFIIDFAHAISDTFSEQEVIIVYLNSSLKMTFKRNLPKTMFNTEFDNLNLITLDAMQHKATAIVVFGKCSKDDFCPSQKDKKISKDIALIFKNINIKFLEFLIITPNTYLSFRDLSILS